MHAKNKTDYVSDKTQMTIGTIIGPGAVFSGNLTAPETVRIDGTLEGDCMCEANLILGKDGCVRGDITAQNISLSGKVTGDVTAFGKLELLPTAKLTGDVTAKSLIIDEKACFDGRCTMTAPPDPAAETGPQKNAVNQSKESKSPAKTASDNAAD